jgi:hypothetical protein
MTNKWCDLTATHGETNCRVDQVGKKGNTVFEVVPRDLHDTGRMLENGYFRAKKHLSSTIEKTILRLAKYCQSLKLSIAAFLLFRLDFMLIKGKTYHPSIRVYN